VNQQKGTAPSETTGVLSKQAQPDLRERVGLSITTPDTPAGAAELVDVIVEAEASGVQQLWMTQNPTLPDSLTVFAAAFQRTNRVRLGTSIVPIYPRHPLALAQQAATVAALGPGRLRLGVGPSHRPRIESTYGLPMDAPLAHLKEYVRVLRAALWEGNVDHRGPFFTAKVTLNTAPGVPLLMAALGRRAFGLAGEMSDGAISWNCPVPYLLDVALPALHAAAHAANRAAPPLIAHVWVALSSDATAVRVAAKKALAGYARLPFYVNMFAAAGYPVQADGTASDALVDNLVVMGDAMGVAGRLNDLLAAGIDELLLTGLYLSDVAAERTQLIRLVGQL
jgi:F420-dependent oxidoreductase-like protein